jgi:hypothetical protein
MKVKIILTNEWNKGGGREKERPRLNKKKKKGEECKEDEKSNKK